MQIHVAHPGSRDDGPVYGGPYGDVACGDVIGGATMTAADALELIPRVAVTLVDQLALGASAGGVASIDKPAGNSCEQCLVRDEPAQLSEGPARVFRALTLANRYPNANPTEILQCDSAPGGFGLGDESLADPVILDTAKASLPTRKVSEVSLGALESR